MQRFFFTLVEIEHPADLPALRSVLARHHLQPGRQDPLLYGPSGQLPIIGGEPTAIEISWLGEGAVACYGQVHSITANPEQCQLLFELASQGCLVLGSEPGPPHVIICGGTHLPDVVIDDTLPPEWETVCFIDSPGQLHQLFHQS
ncbi:hypothetical protein C5L39_04085 [Corynebacterium alimapuense]|uniref:Uncharacterized protein n=1 Tax=Corynebacterium alimapuense TaxID=1576874 RepID=A0A3M8K8H4_9CORY|nr:hypothetical protein C5L39_04085 [Corynebacterium alimapuense]